LCNFCFETLGLNRLEITAAVQNYASIGVARRCGFKEEGVSRDFECLRGQFHDHLRLSKLARDN
jgi:ribosomal-protein-serine acetyltransferase